MSDVLVLSPGYEPVGLITWQRAMELLRPESMDGEVHYPPVPREERLRRPGDPRVEIVRTYEDRKIGGGSWSIDMPSVVRYMAGDFARRWRKRVRFSRNAIYARDGGRCSYCGIAVPRSEYTYDHVVPQARGGRTVWENVVCACLDCNQRKRDRTPAEAGMKLRKLPVRPQWLPAEIFAPALKRGMPAQWKDYLGHIEDELRSTIYWNADLET